MIKPEPLFFRLCAFWNAFKSIGLIVFLSITLSCGIEEYYFLPQVDDIVSIIDTETDINVPSLSSYSYAEGFSIFYRIYLSGEPSGSTDSISLISQSLVNDYYSLRPLTDPTNISSIPSFNTFTNLRYYELEFDPGFSIDKSGGSYKIIFHTGGQPPEISKNGGQPYKLRRSGNYNTKLPNDGNFYFLGSSELINNSNAISSVNFDVAPGSGSPEYAYAAMYIVAVGYNPVNFTRIFSKPTLINIFILPKI